MALIQKVLREFDEEKLSRGVSCGSVKEARLKCPGNEVRSFVS